MIASRPSFIAQSEADCDAWAFVDGALRAFIPERSAYEVAPPDRRLDSYERAQHCQNEIARIDREDKLAALDRCLAAIAARRDIADLRAA